MRFLGSFLSSLLFVAVICSVGFAQDKDKFKLSALPENATQAETQEWLTAALLQNSAYLAKVNQAVRSLGSRSSDTQAGYIDTKISEVKFQGSVLSYRTNRSVQISSGGVQTSGGGGFPGCGGTSVAIEAPDANRDVVLKYIQTANKVAPRSDGNWRLAPWPGAVVATYLTSPAAAGLPAPPGLRLTPMGAAPGGFVKLRVETA